MGCYCVFARGTAVGLTRNDITGIHGIIVFDESKAVHKLDLGDLSSAVGFEMRLDISLGSYSEVRKVNLASTRSRLEAIATPVHTITREIAQVQPLIRYLRHGEEAFFES